MKIILASIALVFCSPLAIADEEAHKQFEMKSTADFYFNDIKSGTGSAQVIYIENKSYYNHAEIRMQTSKDTWISDNYGKIVNNRAIPEYSQIIHTGPQGKFYEKIRFNWVTKKAVVNSTIPNYEAVEKIIPLDKEAHDGISLGVQIRLDTLHGIDRDNYWMIDGAKGYELSSFVIASSEEVIFPSLFGNKNAKKVVIKKNNSDEEIKTIWLDTDNHLDLIESLIENIPSTYSINGEPPKPFSMRIVTTSTTKREITDKMIEDKQSFDQDSKSQDSKVIWEDYIISSIVTNFSAEPSRVNEYSELHGSIIWNTCFGYHNPCYESSPATKSAEELERSKKLKALLFNGTKYKQTKRDDIIVRSLLMS